MLGVHGVGEGVQGLAFHCSVHGPLQARLVLVAARDPGKRSMKILAGVVPFLENKTSF